ncbi:hypothetical protein HAX54_011976, partial [Datura stramonium]|nr:hypothetical protein [Datura stramonium]
ALDMCWLHRLLFILASTCSMLTQADFEFLPRSSITVPSCKKLVLSLSNSSCLLSPKCQTGSLILNQLSPSSKDWASSHRILFDADP